MKKQTLCVHAGTYLDPVTGGVNSPIFTSTANEYVGRDKQAYPRYFNTPNQDVVVKKVCALEGAEDGVLFGSGMAAISTTLLALAGTGDHIVMQAEVYGGSQSLATQFLIPNGFDVALADTNADAIINACTDNTRLIYLESPTNPLISLVDIRKVSAFARDRGIVTVIDNTFATPVLQNPVALGIDVVLHSGTKYLGGHADLSCGIAVCNKTISDKIRARAKLLGGHLDTQACALLERSLKTLSLRVERQSENAMHLAAWLADQPGVARVYYPGLESSPDHALAQEQMRQFGAMLSFELRSQTTEDFLSRLQLIRPTLSLGGVESVICVPAETSHLYLSPEERARIGISDRLLRLSVGVEHVEDLIADLSAALA